MFSPVLALQAFLCFLREVYTVVKEGRQPEETERWRLKMMGKLGTMPESIAENQEGHSSVFLYVFIYWNSNGFSSLCDTRRLSKIKSSVAGRPPPWVRGRGGATEHAWPTPAQSAPSTPGWAPLCRKWTHRAPDKCQEGGRKQNESQGLTC